MPIVSTMQFELSGFDGAPGINTWTFVPVINPGPNWDYVAQTCIGVYTGLEPYLAPGVTVSVLPEVHTFNDVTGELLTVDQIAQTYTLTAGNASDGNTSRASQMKLRFSTGRVVNNRLLQGGFYFGPIGEKCLDGGGRLGPEVSAAVPLAFNDVLSEMTVAAQLAVWHRPKNGTGGLVFPVAGVSVGRYPAVMRSRNGR